MAIKLLSEQLASQIAAGEVVERPASVVKELVENALDAGATIINIDIRGGGQELIQISDDGSGIPAEQIETAFLRHATSKIQQVDDLNAIKTLGFRGEALAAIAAVSKVTVVTRTEAEPAGTRLVLEGGHRVSLEQTGAPTGTVIAVEQLFYNTPARLKFLKSPTTQRRHIDEFITRYAMAYPEIRFRLSHNGKITFQTDGNGNLRDVMLSVYGADTARELLEIKANDSIPRVYGYTAPPNLHRANRSQITLFVNGRWIKDQKLTYAIIQAYHTLLPTGRYPIAAVFLEMNPFDLDVNVHPAKTEVRFKAANKLFGIVQRAVRETLVSDSPIRPLSHFDSFSPFPKSRNPGWQGSLEEAPVSRQWENNPEEGQLAIDLRRPPSHPLPVGDSSLETGSWPPTTPISPAQQSGPDVKDPWLEGQKLPMMRVIGQVGAAFIIAEGPNGMYLIDQHAAHERILYEQFLAAWGQDQLPSQTLVNGVAVTVTPQQAVLLNDQLPLLEHIGFAVEPFGPNSFMVRALPSILAKRTPADALMSVVEDLERGDKPMQEAIEDKIVKRVCKTASVKAGQTLSTQEMEAMIQQLEQCESPHTCPHGRPTLIFLSVAQLAREFGRI